MATLSQLLKSAQSTFSNAVKDASRFASQGIAAGYTLISSTITKIPTAMDIVRQQVVTANNKVKQMASSLVRTGKQQAQIKINIAKDNAAKVAITRANAAIRAAQKYKTTSIQLTEVPKRLAGAQLREILNPEDPEAFRPFQLPAGLKETLDIPDEPFTIPDIIIKLEIPPLPKIIPPPQDTPMELDVFANLRNLINAILSIPTMAGDYFFQSFLNMFGRPETLHTGSRLQSLIGSEVLEFEASEPLLGIRFGNSLAYKSGASTAPRGNKSILFGVAGSILVWLGAIGSATSAMVEPYSRDLIRRVNRDMPSALPNPQDLIRMQLREVFQEPDRTIQLPPKVGTKSINLAPFYNYMEELGYNKYWSDSYWAAHWQLPSVGQAFEMFHRIRGQKARGKGAFSEDKLRQLLAKLDILPDFHDNLIDIAYRPIGRIDIRRMWRIREIEEEDELVSRYQDLGYSPSDSQNLSNYTVREEELRDAADIRSVLMDAYRNEEVDVKTLNRFVAPTFRDPAVYKIWRDLTDIQIERKKKKTGGIKVLSKSDVLSMFKNGVIGEATARTTLSDLGYDGADIQLLLKSATESLRETARDKELTRSQVENMFKLNILDEGQAQGHLIKQGFKSEDINLMFEEWKQELVTEPKKLTKGNIETFFKLGIISEQQTRNLLDQLNFGRATIDNFIREFYQELDK